MRVAVFSTHQDDRHFLSQANQGAHELRFLEPRLSSQTASLAHGFGAVCVFVNDQLNRAVLETLAEGGTKIVALRCAGFNNVDLPAAQELEMRVVRVPAYSPHAVAEHTLGLILALNRGFHRAHARVREGNFSLHGLLGFDLYGRTVGVVGTGKIGAIVAEMMQCMGCKVLAYDPQPDQELQQRGIFYAPLENLLGESDIITLHCPLLPQTYHVIDRAALARCKKGVMLINTSRGGLVDTHALIEGLKTGKIGYLGLDVYEEEADLFFEDLSNAVIHDDVFARLLTFPNVLITGHQAFFTEEALSHIAETTIENITACEQGKESENEVTVKKLKG